MIKNYLQCIDKANCKRCGTTVDVFIYKHTIIIDFSENICMKCYCVKCYKELSREYINQNIINNQES